MTTISNAPSNETKPYIGGQAVLEGVMMRAPCGVTIAVRRPDGTLIVREGPATVRWAQNRIWKLPGFRGVAALVESMMIGYDALRFSADQLVPEQTAPLEETAKNENGAPR